MRAILLLAWCALPLILSAEARELRLDRDLGQASGIVLRGPSASGGVLFTMPRGRPVEAAQLEVRFRHSATLVAGSSLTVSVNGTPIHTARITPGDPGETAFAEQIPAGILHDYNHLEFQSVLHSSPSGCESPTDPGLWLSIAPGSLLHFELGMFQGLPKPADFPAPLADPLESRQTPLRFVLSPSRPASDYSIAARIAGSFGYLLEYRSLEISADSGFDPQADVNQVLIGTPEQLQLQVPGLSEAVAEGWKIVENPARPGRFLMLVAGADAVSLRKTANALPETIRLAGLLPPRDVFPLSAIAGQLGLDVSGGGVTLRGSEPPAIVIPLRPAAGEHFVRGEQVIHLNYAYSPHVDPASSAVEVTLNGKALRGQAIEKAGGSAAEHLDVVLPSEALGEENTLELRFHLYTRAAACGSATGSPSGQIWVTLFDDSSFSLPRDFYGDVPNLALLRRGGFPLRESETILVTRPEAAAQMLNVAFWLGRISGTVPAVVRFASELSGEERRQANLIMVDTGAMPLSIEESISPWNPQRVILSIRGSDPGRIQEPATTAWLGGSRVAMDADGSVHVTREAPTQRFGIVALNRRVKYWVMDNVLPLAAESIAAMFVGFFFLRFLRRNYFPPLQEDEIAKTL